VWRPGVVVEEPGEGVDGGDVVFAGGGEVAADLGEAFSAGLITEARRDLPMDLYWSEISFGLVVWSSPRIPE
jgi:hypothetical protein